MIYRFFKQTYQTQIVFTIVAGILLWLLAMVYPIAPKLDPSFSALGTWITHTSAEWYFAPLALVMLLLEGAILSIITGRYKILGLTNLLPAFLYVLLMSYSSSLLTLSNAVVSNFFVILFLQSVIYNQGKKESYLIWFNASLFAGMAILINPGNVILLLLLWISLITYQVYSLREWIISVLGILVVFMFYTLIIFWNNQIGSGFLYLRRFWETIFHFKDIDIPLRIIPYLSLTLLITLVTIPRMAIKLDESIIQTRKRLNVVIFHALILLIGMAINHTHWEFFFAQLLIPVSITISRLITNMKKDKFKDWIIILIVLTLISERILFYA